MSSRISLSLFFICIIINVSLFAQTIILNEEFKNNENNWQTEGDETERVKLSAGRYDLETLSKTNWHLFTIKKSVPSEVAFSIESVITKLPTSEDYQIIAVQEVQKILDAPDVLYNHSYYKSVTRGLELINKYQKLGIRFDFIRSDDKFAWKYASSEVSAEIKKKRDVSAAIGFATAKFKEGFRNVIEANQKYGIIWGSNDNQNLFSFNILPDLQYFQVISLINGQWTNLIKYTKAKEILTGTSSNKLTVSCFDGTLFFSINDEVVGKAPAQSFFGDGIGFWVDPETHISVDNLIVKDYLANTNTNTKSDSYTSSGSGLIISDQGYITTNYHVISGATEISVELNLEGKKIIKTAKVIQVDKNNDLAIIKIECEGIPKPVFRCKYTTAEVGSEVFSMGYPLLSMLGDELKITDGIISSRTGFQGDISCYQISAPIQPGNSGGPLFDKQGNLIGITNAGVKSAENVGYAIKVSYLKNLFELINLDLSSSDVNILENLSFTDQIKALSQFVTIIKVK